MLLDTLELVRVRAVFVETFAFELRELLVPLFVVTVGERLTLVLVVDSLVVVEREVTFVSDGFDLDTTPSLVDVDRVTVPSLNEVLVLTSPLLLRIDALLLSTDETLLCDEVGRAPDDL